MVAKVLRKLHKRRINIIFESFICNNCKKINMLLHILARLFVTLPPKESNNNQGLMHTT